MSTIKANTLLHSDGSTTNPPAIPALDKRMAKAWVNFKGSGTVAINDSYNASSITDTTTGSYSVNLINTMSDTNYCVASSNNDWNATAAAYPESTSKVKVYVENNNSLSDTGVIGVIVFGS